MSAFAAQLPGLFGTPEDQEARRRLREIRDDPQRQLQKLRPDLYAIVEIAAQDPLLNPAAALRKWNSRISADQRNIIATEMRRLPAFGRFIVNAEATLARLNAVDPNSAASRRLRSLIADLKLRVGEFNDYVRHAVELARRDGKLTDEQARSIDHAGLGEYEWLAIVGIAVAVIAAWYLVPFGLFVLVALLLTMAAIQLLLQGIGQAVPNLPSITKFAAAANLTALVVAGSAIALLWAWNTYGRKRGRRT